MITIKSELQLLLWRICI